MMTLTNGESVSAIVKADSSRKIKARLDTLAQWVADNTHWVNETVN
jgi:hypothetical protein